jgi:hypothetical protein
MGWLSSAAIGERRIKTLLHYYFFNMPWIFLSYFAHGTGFKKERRAN